MSFLSTQPALAQNPLTPDEALKALLDGNERFASGRLSSFDNDLKILRDRTVDKQESLHPALAALKCIGGTMPVDAAVRGLVRGIQLDEFLIIPGFGVKLTYWMHRLTPTWLLNVVTDSVVAGGLRAEDHDHPYRCKRRVMQWENPSLSFGKPHRPRQRAHEPPTTPAACGGRLLWNTCRLERCEGMQEAIWLDPSEDRSCR